MNRKEKILIKIFGRKRLIRWMRAINRKMRRLSMKTHAEQMRLEWNTADTPEWYDHYLDMNYQWKKTRMPYWVERGVFNLLAIKDKSKVLELCCGDGFNSYYFYSGRAESVTAVDFDKEVVDYAIKNNSAPNIHYSVADIRTNMPAGSFDNITWDAAIEHFTKDEISHLMKEMKKRLGTKGILSGYTILEKNPGKGLVHHESEFKSKDDLMRFFTPYFKNVKVFETIYSARHNLYFYASDEAALPFDPTWTHSLSTKK